MLIIRTSLHVMPPAKQAHLLQKRHLGPHRHELIEKSHQTDDSEFDNKIARAKKLTETAKAHLDGSNGAAQRYSSILGISQPKP